MPTPSVAVIVNVEPAPSVTPAPCRRAARRHLHQGVLERLFAHFAATDNGLSAWVLVMVDHHQQHRDDPDARALLAEIYGIWHGQVTRFVTALQHGGWIPADRAPRMLARQAFAYAEGTIAHARLYQHGHDDLVDGLATLLRG